MRPLTLYEAFEGLEAVSGRGPTFLREGQPPVTCSFAHLMGEAAQVQGRLQAAGLMKGDRVGLVLGEPIDFIVAFVALVRAGAIPVPAAAASSVARRSDHTGLLAKMFGVARIKFLVTSQAGRAALAPLTEHVATLARVEAIEALHAGPRAAPYPVALRPDDLCLIQFTSGSTASPRGVAVTHASLAANAKAIALDVLRLDPEHDVAVSWLPLHHDMGLIGHVLTALLYRIPVVYLSTPQFIKHPGCWMKAVSDHRATLSFAPNFALALAARRADAASLERLDLRCLRTLGCGAEPISADVLRRFAEVFAPAGLRPEALRPCYGLAEATLAVSFGAEGRAPRIESLQRAALEHEGLARATNGPAVEAAVEVVSCGPCIAGHAIEIVSDDGEPLGEDRVGQIVFRGPSVAPGYLDDCNASAQVFRENGLHTGDLGFVRGGELFIVGRAKDMIILHGRNHSPQEIEHVVESVDGLRQGGVAAFSVGDRDTERLIVVAETRSADIDALARQVRRRVAETCGIGRLEIVWTLPGGLPRTTSGKIQRGRARQLYQQGAFAAEGVRGAPSSTSVA